MTIKVYVSGICGSMEVRKQQQRVLFILQGLPIELQVIDITEPGREEERNFMQEECKKHNKKEPLPPQIFNENEYCGDYTDFQLANDDDIVMRFLKLEDPSSAVSETKDEAASITQNGLGSHNDAQDKEVKDESKDEAAQEAGEKIVKINKVGVVDSKSSTNETGKTASSKDVAKEEEEEEEEESSEEESSEEEESEEEN